MILRSNIAFTYLILNILQKSSDQSSTGCVPIITLTESKEVKCEQEKPVKEEQTEAPKGNTGHLEAKETGKQRTSSGHSSTAATSETGSAISTASDGRKKKSKRRRVKNNSFHFYKPYYPSWVLIYKSGRGLLTTVPSSPAIEVAGNDSWHATLASYFEKRCLGITRAKAFLGLPANDKLIVNFLAVLKRISDAESMDIISLPCQHKMLKPTIRKFDYKPDVEVCAECIPIKFNDLRVEKCAPEESICILCFHFDSLDIMIG